MDDVIKIPDEVPFDCVFDAMENILLAQRICQHGQFTSKMASSFSFSLYRAQKLKEDVHFRNTQRIVIEPQMRKRLGEMLHYLFEVIISVSTNLMNTKRLFFTYPKRVSRPNHNRSIMWELECFVMYRFEGNVTLSVLVARHPKNRCGGALGMVKRKIRQSNGTETSEMFQVIEESADTNITICSSFVFFSSLYLSHFSIL